jgi:hypothetical protein
MKFMCAQCARCLSDEKDMRVLKDGAIYCPECFEQFLDENIE